VPVRVTVVVKFVLRTMDAGQFEKDREGCAAPTVRAAVEPV